MSYRFAVRDIEGVFANIHANSIEQAIQIACHKVPGHDPKRCRAERLQNDCREPDVCQPPPEEIA